MDLFAITCTTCKTRLRVRDSMAVGQILACPKCGGMVMVKPPPAWQEAGEQRSDLPTAPDAEGPRVPFNETVHNSAFDALEELLSDAPPKMQSPTPAPPAANATPSGSSSSVVAPSAAKPRFVGGPPVRRSATPPPAPGNTSATPHEIGPVPPPVKSAASPGNGGTSKEKQLPAPASNSKLPVPPPPAESSGGSSTTATAPVNSRRSHWLVAGSIAIGILLAFTAVTAAIHYLRPVDVGRPISPKKNLKPAMPAVATAAAPVATQEATPTSSATTAEISASQPASESATVAVASSDIPPQAPTTGPATDPLGLVKEASPTAAAPATTDPLAKFDRILGGSDERLGKTAARPTAAPPAPPATDTAPARPLAPRPPPRVVDVARQLSFPLAAMETSGTALAEFVHLMSELSAIPITLDVPFIPVTPESPVAFRLANSTVGNAITEALKPLRLEYVIENDQLIVRRAEPKLPASFTVSVKDLTAGDEQQMTDLVELLKAVVEPAAWTEGEEAGSFRIDAAKASLVISHPRSVRHPIQVRLAIEKIRAAHTPPLAHDLKVDPVLFKLDTRSALAKPRLDKTISLNYSQPARLLSILDRLGRETGARLLVDWRDVASGGWNPAAEATLVVRNEPLSAALDALLTPLDLTWRIIDGQTIQVVTLARLADQGELELYKIDDLLQSGKTADELIAQVRAALGDGTFMAGGGSGELRFDEGGKCLLAWLPQPKQRELETLLAKWRAK